MLIKQQLRRVPFLVRVWQRICYTTFRWGKHLFRLHQERFYNLDLRECDTPPLAKKALLSYIVYPFSVAPDDLRILGNINNWFAKEIVRVLNQLGYMVDVIDYRDTSFVPHEKYNLFIGHGGINFENIVRQLSKSSIKIYFSTGCYWKFHNEQEFARIAALRERRNFDLSPDRLINNPEEGALIAADGIIGIGNNFTRETYAHFSPVTMINGNSLFDDHYEQHDKDFERGRMNFLYFAGGGPVHKGLDLLLEVFAQLPQHLYICQRIDKQFKKAYYKELYQMSNIHFIGRVQPRSKRFYELMDMCNYVILPSCSEGQAQSVVECMNQGLIPVVSKASGLDTDGYGIILNYCTIEEISEVVLRVSSFPAYQCKDLSMKARKAALDNFSEAMFSIRLKEAIESMVKATIGSQY